MDFTKIEEHRAKQKALDEKTEHKDEIKAQVKAVVGGATHVASAIRQEAEKTRQTTQKVEVTNNPKITVEHKQDNTPIVTGLEEVKKAVKALKLNPTIKVSPTDVTVPEVNLQPLLDAIEKLEMNPVINVAPTPVNIPEVDFSPIIKAIPEAKAEGINLDNFRAQDLDEEEEGIQYVGFASPNGQWMIIRNDVENNNMRYKFGAKDYSKAWPKFVTYKYKTLDKAINEI